MKTARAMYGLRRACAPVMSFLMNACTIHLLSTPTEPSTSLLTQGLNDLQEMSVYSPYAARCVRTIGSLANKWNIFLPGGVPMNALNDHLWPPAVPALLDVSTSRKPSSRNDTNNEVDPSHRNFHRPVSISPAQHHVQSQIPFDEHADQMDSSRTPDSFVPSVPAWTMSLPIQDLHPTTTTTSMPMEGSSRHWPIFDDFDASRFYDQPDFQEHHTTAIDLGVNGGFGGLQWQ